MKRIETDVAVIGAGTAGLAAYRAAIQAGKRAVVIEGGPHGTTCARVGCMPSKLLIAAAEAAHATHKWEEFGIRIEGRIAVDGKAVMARVRRERDRFVGFVLKSVEAIPADQLIHGRARFIDDRTLQIDDHATVVFSSAVIATGSSPAIPAMLREAGDLLVVNDHVFDWDDLPASAAVFGPGVIGLELGQALHRLGVRIRVFGRGNGIGPLSDPAVREYATRTFQDELALDTDARVHAIQRDANGVSVRYTSRSGETVTESFDYVVAATGRTPNVRNLGLERTTIALDAQGIPLYDRSTMQCGRSAVFIAGDVNADVPLLHEAADEGVIAGRNAATYPDVRAALRRTPLAVVFSDPQIAIVGARNADLVPGRFVTGAVSFEDQGRSRVMLKNRGLLHVYADQHTGRLLGAEMVAPDAEHLAHLLAWAIQGNLTVSDALERPFYHPVVEEGLRTALRDAAAKLAAHIVPRAA
ncbi:MAG TPA: dihydrolipoyl dehydrogenase [Burkholderiales bacterium]|nr:dihydrolipoyl dehydrogenase [Burkholderiales bacterium]